MIASTQKAVATTIGRCVCLGGTMSNPPSLAFVSPLAYQFVGVSKEQVVLDRARDKRRRSEARSAKAKGKAKGKASAGNAKKNMKKKKKKKEKKKKKKKKRTKGKGFSGRNNLPSRLVLVNGTESEVRAGNGSHVAGDPRSVMQPGAG